MAFYSGFFDESGDESGPMFTFGGLVLDVECLKRFEDDWSKAIHPLSSLHTSPFLAGTVGSGFEQWNDKGLVWKQELLKRAARVIGKHTYATFSTALEMADYRKFCAKQPIDFAVAHPYALCARFSAVQVAHWSDPNSISGRVKLVFENRNKADRAEVASVFHRDRLDVPQFCDKSSFPLQAADLIAVLHARKVMRKASFNQVHPAFAELNQMLHTRDILGYASLTSMWNRLSPHIVSRSTPPGEDPDIYFETDLSTPRRPFRKL